MAMRIRWIVVMALALGVVCCAKEPSLADYRKMAQSTSSYDREMAVYGLLKNYKPEFEPYVGNLLLDSDISVRHAALKNIAKTRSRNFMPALRALYGAASVDERPLVKAALDELNQAVGAPPSGSEKKD